MEQNNQMIYLDKEQNYQLIPRVLKEKEFNMIQSVEVRSLIKK